MRQAAQEDKLSEILVLGDEHATLFPGERQQRFVRCVGEAVPGGKDIVPEVRQRRQERPRRGAYIDQKLHEASRTATRSCTCSPANER